MAKVLVVDDEKIIRSLLKEIVGKEGHEVLTAKDGAEALEKIEEDKPDLIITDIFMPEKTGLETIVEAKKIYGDIKIIAISGDSISRKGGHRHCLDIAECLGSSTVLEKPFSREEVIEAVKKALNT
jgi:CheY-like chemotaxis protein